VSTIITHPAREAHPDRDAAARKRADRLAKATTDQMQAALAYLSMIDPEAFEIAFTAVAQAPDKSEDEAPVPLCATSPTRPRKSSSQPAAAPCPRWLPAGTRGFARCCQRPYERPVRTPRLIVRTCRVRLGRAAWMPGDFVGGGGSLVQPSYAVVAADVPNFADDGAFLAGVPGQTGDALLGVAEVGDDLGLAAEGADAVSQGGELGD